MADIPDAGRLLQQVQDGYLPHILDMPVSEDLMLSAALLAGPDDLVGPSRVAVVWDPVIGGDPVWV